MHDLLIRNGMIMDGSGKPGYPGDVLIDGDRITGIGHFERTEARKVLDASGLVVAPGFIDSHAHSDTAFLRDDSCASKLYQGITTEVTGQCGDSPFPCTAGAQEPGQYASFEEFLRLFDAEGRRMAVNQAILVGHGTLRAAVLGYEDRQATGQELERMKGLLRRDLAAGAWGMSLGLEYAPGFFAGVEELQALGAVVKEYDGLMPCHLRSEGLHIHDAIGELISAGRASGVKIHVSHLKLDNYRVHGTAEQVWAQIEQACSEGIRISADMYPFTASCTSLDIRCPKWSREGGSEALLARLQGERRGEILDGIRQHYFNAERAETCLFNDDGGYWPAIVGRTLRQVAEEDLYTTDYAEAAAEVLTRTRGRANCIFFVMNEEDMLYFLRQDVGIGSDGYALPGDPALVHSKPHPRSYATIPEFFRLARIHDICTVEEAVRRVTAKPADMIGMTDRGRLQSGMIADITVFDPEKIGPKATYLQPVQLSTGIEHVIIGGQIAMENGVQTQVRAGRFLHKPVCPEGI